MERVSLVLDGKSVQIEKGKSILEAAQQHGIDIPTLCHDPRLKPTAACRLCLVEVEKMRGLIPACSTKANEGMVVKTTSAELIETRRMALELLLSDHYGDCVSPCHLECPAGIDIQGFIAYIANGDYPEALQLIKDSNPLPLVCGRVCPRFCETKCRRNLVDGPVAINALKRFVADFDLNSTEPYTPQIKPSTGHKVAIVGGGPAGLTAAYYLAIEGHEVTIFESSPKLGGMLRYGIPEYRLPKAILDKEIESITRLCHNVHLNKSLGKDLLLQELQESGFEAVFLALGAQADQKMKISGEKLPNVYTGISFLRDVTLGKNIKMGQKVVVVGGGNTAIDAARTAIRLGAAEVTIVYRRSRDEMPANDEEVKGAEEEGVHFQFLTNPVAITERDGKAGFVKCLKMALGEPDASGRRKPEPVTGSEFNIEIDTVIMAIGQSMDSSGIKSEISLQVNRKGFINASDTMETSLPGVFAGGDCTTGPATAVAAIGAGHKAAISINAYLLCGKVAAHEKPFNCSKGELDEIDEKDFVDVERVSRVEMPALKPEKRKTNFKEIELGLTEDMAKTEASRCLSCGCQDVFECKLRKLATEYQVADGNYTGRKRHYPVKTDEHELILRDQNKCILCGRCVRICNEVEGVSALGFVNRGFATTIEPALGLPLCETNCTSCGLCISTCPTGAITAKVPLAKPGPWQLNTSKSICPFCGVGCNIEFNTINGKIVAVTSPVGSPVNNGNLCAKGLLNLSSLQNNGRLSTPLIKRDGKLIAVSWEEALDFAAQGLKRIKEIYGAESLAVLGSPCVSNEEAYVIQKMARIALETNNLGSLSIPNDNRSLKNSLGRDASTCSYKDILSSDFILVYNCDLGKDYPIIELKIREAVNNGSKLIVLNSRQTKLDILAKINFRVNQQTRVELLQSMLGYIMSYGLLDRKFVDAKTSGFADFARENKNYPLEKMIDVPWMNPVKIIEATHLFIRARKPVIIMNADTITTFESELITNLALVTGNIGRDGAGILVMRSGGNAQGHLDMGMNPYYLPGQELITSDEARFKYEAKWGHTIPEINGKDSLSLIQSIERGEIRGVLAFGKEALGSLQSAIFELPIFSVLVDTEAPEGAPYPDVILPGVGFYENEGSFTNCENLVQTIQRVNLPVAGKYNWEIAAALAERLDYPLEYETLSDIQEEIGNTVPPPKLIPETDIQKISGINRTNGNGRYRFHLQQSLDSSLNLAQFKEK